LLTTADSGQKISEYDQLLAEAVKMHQEHEIKAKYFIPKMYDALRKEDLSPFDAADRIYKDVVGIWQKDTIRRLLPVEAKDQAARERQVLSRRSMAAARNAAGLILRDSSSSLPPSSTATIAAAATTEENPHYPSQEDNDPAVTKLEQENSQLKKEISDLENTKKSLLERALRLERSLAEQQRQQQRDQQQQSNGHQAKDGSASKQDEITILLPPNLFMKTYALMRGSTKPLLLKVKAGEAIDVDKANLPR
jgi:hypothetical protein